MSHNMPKMHYSKVPVSVIKHIKGQANDTTKRPIVRDPRFEKSAGNLN